MLCDALSILHGMRGIRSEVAFRCFADMYDEPIRYADQAFGGFVEFLKARDLYDDTVIVCYRRSWRRIQ
jgi:arylsulfatase A-like enzyme